MIGIINAIKHFFSEADDRSKTIMAAGYDAMYDVMAERVRQVSVEGYTPEHDDEYKLAELVRAAIAYCAAAAYCTYTEQPGYHAPEPPKLAGYPWPWSRTMCWKPGGKRRMLVKAAALIIAEIARMDREDSK